MKILRREETITDEFINEFLKEMNIKLDLKLTDPYKYLDVVQGLKYHEKEVKVD